MTDDQSALPTNDATNSRPAPPSAATACYILATLSVLGGLFLATGAYSALGEEASVWAFVVAYSPSLVSAVILITLGRIAEDVHVIRQNLNC